MTATIETPLRSTAGSHARPDPPATPDRPARSTALAAQLRARLSPAAVVLADEPLARRTTLKVGGPADAYVEPATELDLVELLEFCRAAGVPLRVLGRGSNLLVRDGGIRGVVVSLAQPAFVRVTVTGERLRAGAGARLKEVANTARRHALAGLEFLEGIPGSVGGALRMNAGAHASWVFDVIEQIRYLTPDGEVIERPAGDIPAQYRSCSFFTTNLALAAVFRGRPDRAEAIGERMAAFNRRRWDTQPRQPSAGCIFKNPAALPAGRLIEELGLKGHRIGGAEVSSVHGNFLVNLGHARAADVLALIDLIRTRAQAERGILLETEVEIVGED
ncbi:MAG: UDP-N-acetylmuramate dehydrogenase [Verrucomicrobiales bacterium]|nr:UDP-N-acetylmuramate dehydrogenase [Verrucomicrobiales bacterium]